MLNTVNMRLSRINLTDFILSKSISRIATNNHAPKITKTEYIGKKYLIGFTHCIEYHKKKAPPHTTGIICR